MNKKTLIAVLAVITIIICFFIAGYMYIYSKISKVTFKPLDENDLGITTDTKEIDIEKYTRFVIFGSDSRDTDDATAGRSDTIIIVNINNKDKNINLISVPRDTYVDVPDHGMTKINHAYAYGQEQLSLKTLNTNFGLNLKQYITIDFSGLVNCIDEVGGVEVNLSQEELEFINARLPQNEQIDSVGLVTLNGKQALIHSRNRYIGLDFARAYRQRQILISLINKMSKMNVDEILSLSDELLSNVTTNMDIEKYKDMFVEVASDKEKYAKRITSVQIPATEYGYDASNNGVYYFGYDKNKALNDFKKYYYNNESEE